MGFIIIDLADDTKTMAVNLWNWHPTVELIRNFDVVEPQRIEALHTQCLETLITEPEARLIAQKLQQGVLASLRTGDRVRLDLSVTSEPDDGVMHQGADVDRNYSATFDWLTRFADFCSECRGFKVL